MESFASAEEFGKRHSAHPMEAVNILDYNRSSEIHIPSQNKEILKSNYIKHKDYKLINLFFNF